MIVTTYYFDLQKIIIISGLYSVQVQFKLTNMYSWSIECKPSNNNVLQRSRAYDIRVKPKVYFSCGNIQDFGLSKTQQLVISNPRKYYNNSRRYKFQNINSECSDPVGIMDWGGVLFMSLRVWHLWGSTIFGSRHLIKVLPICHQ